jgi:hypothetical protein
MALLLQLQITQLQLLVLNKQKITYKTKSPVVDNHRAFCFAKINLFSLSCTTGLFVLQK